MIFDDLKKINDPELREKETINYYLNEIKVDKWIKSFSQSIIRFKDRIEFRKNNKLHNFKGPAIEYFNSNDMYYLNGELIEYKKWQTLSKKYLFNKKIKKIKKE